MQLLTKAWFPLRPHPVQAALWRCPDRFVSVRAGRGSGKTMLAKRRLVRYLPTGDGKYLYTNPTREQAKRVAWQDLVNLIHPSWLAGEPNQTELIIRTIWGSELHVCGLDKPQRVEGTQWSGVVVDESADIRPGAVDRSIMPALSQNRGWLWRIGVPKRQGCGAAEFRRVCEDRSLGYTFFHWSAEGVAPDESVELMRQMMDAKDYDEQVKGLALDAGGAAFHAFSVENNVRSGPDYEYDPTKTIIVGSDFNVDPMAWTLSQIKNGLLITFDEIWLRDTNTRDTLDNLWLRYGDHKAGWLFIGDSTSRARKTVATNATPSDYITIKQDSRFKGARIDYDKSNPPVKDRLASCNALLRNAAGQTRAIINVGCRRLIADLQARGLDSTGAPEDATKDMGHITDAWGYVVHKLFPIYRQQTGESKAGIHIFGAN